MKTAKIKNVRQAGMKITRVMILIAVVCALFAVSLPIQGVVAKGPPEEENIVPETVYFSEYSSVYCYGGKVKDKEVASTAIEDRLSANLAPTKGEAQVLSSLWPFEEVASTPYGNGYVVAEFHSLCDWQYSWPFDTMTVADGSWSRTMWTGTSPQYNSDIVKMTDSWTWTGLAISITIPAGAGFSLNGNTVTWGPEYVYNQWLMVHYYSGMSGRGLIIFNFSESNTGSHRFQGYIWVTKVAQRSMI